MMLHPVVVRHDGSLRGSAHVEERRRLGRLALDESARLSGAEGLDDFPRNDAGAPLPRGGWHWSTTNTDGLVGAIVAPFRTALDAERIGRDQLDAVRHYSRPEELAPLAGSEVPAELLLWTAKEAVLKLEGVGLSGLGRCRLRGVEGPQRVSVSYEERSYSVRQLRLGEHILAFACDAPDGYELELHEIEDEVTP